MPEKCGAAVTSSRILFCAELRISGNNSPLPSRFLARGHMNNFHPAALRRIQKIFSRRLGGQLSIGSVFGFTFPLS